MRNAQSQSEIQSQNIIAGFYEAAAEPSLWPQTWSRLCSAFEAQNGLLFRQYGHSDAAEVAATVHWPADTQRVYAGHGMHLDPFARGDLAEPGFNFRLGEAVVAPRDLERSEIYAGFFRRHVAGAQHFLCAKLPLEGAAIAGVGLHRLREDAAFDIHDRAALAGLAGHLAAALRLERLLDEARVATRLRDAILDRLPHGAVITDAAGALIYANQSASRLGRHGGVKLPAAGGGLTCDRAAESAALAKLIASTAHGGAGGTLRVTRAQGLPFLAISVSPLPLTFAAMLPMGQQVAAQGLVLVTIRDLGATSDAGQAQLIELFGLTGAEAGIIPQMAAGETVRQIALSRGVREATVRDQANRVLAKTGASNLRALTAMVSALGCC